MSKECTVVFWDVQHGHSTYIKTPNNRHIVVDLGTGDLSKRDKEFSPLLHLRRSYKVKQLDYVIITHPHLDHIDDILNFDLFKPKVFNRPKNISNEDIMLDVREKDKPKFEKYCEINNRYKGLVQDDSFENPSNPDNWGGLKIQSFEPKSCNKNGYNNHSIILVLEYAQTKIIIPGDNEKCSFEELMKSSKFKNAVKGADILLAPHHGRESGYFLDFVTLVNPNITVVSDGKYCDTSANKRYSSKSNGWLVHRKNKASIRRKCLTTNSDGEILAKFGFNSDSKPFLQVSIK